MKKKKYFDLVGNRTQHRRIGSIVTLPTELRGRTEKVGDDLGGESRRGESNMYPLRFKASGEIFAMWSGVKRPFLIYENSNIAPRLVGMKQKKLLSNLSVLCDFFCSIPPSLVAS